MRGARPGLIMPGRGPAEAALRPGTPGNMSDPDGFLIYYFLKVTRISDDSVFLIS